MKKMIWATLALVTLSFGCKMNNNKDTKMITQDNTTEKTVNLDDLLEVRRSASAAKLPDEIKKIYKEGIDAVATSGVLDRALKVGDKAFDFTLKNQNGEIVSLYNEMKNGPIILTWYRGGWCPYCNISLNFLQERLPDFHKEGASLIAITPELPDQSLNTAEKHQLQFSVLSDVGNSIGKQYGLVFKLTQGVADNYQKNFDLHSHNGDDSDELPIAATYVIDSNGIIQYAFLDTDYRNRAEPDDIIVALKKIK